MTFILGCLLFSYAVPFLTDFPGAQQTAMGGACVALADDAHANMYNPAGLAFQTRPGLAGEWFHVPWERNRYYANGTGVLPIRPGTAAGLYVVGDKQDWQSIWDTTHNHGFAAGANLAHAFGKNLAAGIGLKYLRASLYHTDDYYPESIDIDEGTVACDIGVLGRRDIGLGELRASAGFQTLGPAFRQRAVIGELPTTLRGGVCYLVSVPQLLTPEAEQWVRRYFRFGSSELGEYMLDHWRLVIAYDVNIVLTRYIDSQFDDTWPLRPQHSLGAEVRPLPFFAFRLGYYEDMAADRWSEAGRGWTMGMGLDLKYLRVDIADDRVFWRSMDGSTFRLRLSISASL